MVVQLALFLSNITYILYQLGLHLATSWEGRGRWEEGRGGGGYGGDGGSGVSSHDQIVDAFKSRNSTKQ